MSTPPRPIRALPNIPGTNSPFPEADVRGPVPQRPAEGYANPRPAPTPRTADARGRVPQRQAEETPPLSPTYMNPRPAPTPRTADARGRVPQRQAEETPPLSPTYMNPRPAPTPRTADARGRVPQRQAEGARPLSPTYMNPRPAPTPRTADARGRVPQRQAEGARPLSPTYMNPRPAPTPPPPRFARTPGDGFDADAFQPTRAEQRQIAAAAGSKVAGTSPMQRGKSSNHVSAAKGAVPGKPAAAGRGRG
ncbi:hypothetical protein QFZ63_000189 [Streptomyces sp. B3I7]|nr:hypothetical protein [Streptomyces sp. B3I7]